MKNLAKHRPKKIRLNSDPIAANKFFTSEGTPVKSMKNAFELDKYDEKKHKQLKDIAKEN